MKHLEIQGDGGYGLDVVGESRYQEALEAICEGRKENGHRKKVQATLIYEDANPHDDKAVRVDIEGRTVGYLTRENARRVREQLPPNPPRIVCQAMIVGGWDRGGGDTGSFGVKLDLPIEPVP